jgi:hypothetical protein
VALRIMVLKRAPKRPPIAPSATVGINMRMFTGTTYTCTGQRMLA